MNYPYLRFPKFKNKAVTLSYDDGCIDDRKLVGILNKYGLKCTFNIPSSILGIVRGHDHVKAEEVRSLYLESGHEIALHGRNHLKLTEVDIETARADILLDKNYWERLLGDTVCGMAYAFSAFNDEIVAMLKEVGVVYARGGQETKSFDFPTDWLRMPVTCHHGAKDLPVLIEKFLSPFDDKEEARLFYMYGHSYEFGDDNTWHIIEEFGKQLGNRDDIWYATNMEIYEYVQAYQRLKIFKGEIYNPSDIDVYLYYQENIKVPARSTVQVRRK